MNDIFAENAWYFRNSLVRANYNDLKNGIHETTEYLEIFLRNLLLNENYPLHNRALHISGVFKTSEKVNIENPKVNIENSKANIENSKANIENQKVNIENPKANIENQKLNIRVEKENITDSFTSRTAAYVQKLSEALGSQTVFGRSDVQRVLGLKQTRSSALLHEMAERGIIESVFGFGKGKYRFKYWIG